MQSATLLQRELQYQADNIVDAIDHGSADVVGAVQKACDYLGGQLCEVRWAIERQSQILQQILQVLLNAPDNTSRQYWGQGVKCYEASEYDFARERFSRALDTNRTNYFAYQYLGFIAVHEEKSSEALKNFELALRANIHETLPVCVIREQGGKENPHEPAEEERYSFGLGGRGTKLGRA